VVAQGWCPSTYRIYDAPDGGLARVKVPGGILGVGQARALAAATRRFGSGTIEITSRANLQLRGIGRSEAAELRAYLSAVGLTAPTAEIEDRRNVLASPTAGLTDGPPGEPTGDPDHDEVLDVRPAVAAAVRALDALADASALAHKFGVLIDGGGTPTLRAIALDLSLGAVRLADPDEIVFAVALGDPLDAADVDFALASTPDAVALAVTAAARLCAAPPDEIPAGRMTDVVRALGRRRARSEIARTAPIQPVDARRAIPPHPTSAGAPLGVHPGRGPDRRWVGLRCRDTAVSADHFDALADAAAAGGATEIRLTPWRSVILAELSAAEADVAVRRLAQTGWTGVPADRPLDTRPTVGTVA